MADYTSRIVTTVRKEFALPSPTNWAEVEKVMTSLRNELSSSQTWDDTVKVEARDDEIVFWYELPAKGGA